MHLSSSFLCRFYIAQEIDQPFGQDYNDLPVVEIQQKFNQSLMHLASPLPSKGAGSHFLGGVPFSTGIQHVSKNGFSKAC